MVSSSTLGQMIVWMTHLTIALIAVILASKIWLYRRTRKSRFGRIVFLITLMLAAFLFAEVMHLWDMLRSPAGAELTYTILALVGFGVFTLLMRLLESFSVQVGLVDRGFITMLKLQEQLCPICRKVTFTVPIGDLIMQGLVTPEGTLAPGVTLQQLIDRGLATHAKHQMMKRGR